MPLQNVTIIAPLSLDGFSFEKRVLESANDKGSTSYSVAAAKVGQLTTRTDANTGTLTMVTGHGFTNGQRLDIYWDGGCRRGVVIGSVATDSVPIDLGSGDNLPDNLTAITAMVPTEASFPLTVADAVIIAVKCDAEAQFTFCEDDDTESYSFHTTPIAGYDDQSDFWAEGFGDSPLTQTTIAKVFLSHADSSAAHVMTAAYLSA